MRFSLNLLKPACLPVPLSREVLHRLCRYLIAFILPSRLIHLPLKTNAQTDSLYGCWLLARHTIVVASRSVLQFKCSLHHNDDGLGFIIVWQSKCWPNNAYAHHRMNLVYAINQISLREEEEASRRMQKSRRRRETIWDEIRQVSCDAGESQRLNELFIISRKAKTSSELVMTLNRTASMGRDWEAVQLQNIQ